MPRYFLRKLQIEGFRGINNEGEPLELLFKSDHVNSIFASNAQGKSSIFDALCFAFKGDIPKLTSLQRVEGAGQYYNNQFHTSNTSTIILTLEPEDGSPDVIVEIKRTPDGTRIVQSPTGHTNPQQLLSDLNSEFCLLDYRTFIKFIEDSPLDRGRALSALLGLSKISTFRQALEALANKRTLNTDFHISQLEEQTESNKRKKSTLEANINTAYSKLTGQHLLTDFDDTVVFVEVDKALKNISLLSRFLETKSCETVDFNEVRSIIRDAERSSDQEKLIEVSKKLARLQSLAVDPAESEESATLRRSIESLQDTLSQTQGPLLKTHYESALVVLQSDQWNDNAICPTCETKQENPLIEKIQNKLKEFSKANSLQLEIKDKWRTSIINGRINQLQDILESDATVRGISETLQQKFQRGHVTPSDLDQIEDIRTTLETGRIKEIAECETVKIELEKTLPPSLVTLTDQVSTAEHLRQQIFDLRSTKGQLANAEAILLKRKRWISFISDAAKIFATAEVGLSSTKATELHSQYQAMYHAITYNSEVKPYLSKSPNSEELYLKLATFYGKTNLTATALLSESYRNALAFSIFISAALKSSSACFIVFDDVTSSFDAGHQFNLMEQLRTVVARPVNPSGPQIILLSHDGLLEKYFDRISNETAWHHQRLQGLSPHGSIITQTQDASRVRGNAERFLNAGQVTQAEPLVRQYLEFKLLEIIRKVNIPVPIDFSIRDDKKMVQHSLDAIKGAVELNFRAAGLILTSAQRNDLNTSLVPSMIANWVSHYSTGSSPTFSPHVLLQVLDTIDLLASSFQYDCTCTGPTRKRYYKSLTSKPCSC